MTGMGQGPTLCCLDLGFGLKVDQAPTGYPQFKGSKSRLAPWTWMNDQRWLLFGGILLRQLSAKRYVFFPTKQQVVQLLVQD